LSASNQHSVAIVPIGSFGLELIEAISAEVERIFGFQSEVMPILQDLSFAYDANRKQFHSTPILEQLAARIPPEFTRVLAIVNVDLFIPILTHVYGEAQLGGKACIVSTFRLNGGHANINLPEPYLGRIVKEATHELGHTFQLRHCSDHTCLMHYCRNERDVDRKSDQLCRYCQVLLEDELKKERRLDENGQKE
jgi:archaemetzincin